jgi:nitrate reductase NapAB chaperone NapD
MPVSGVIVVCEQGSLKPVQDEIDAHPRLEVREVAESNLIVVTDTATVDEDRQAVKWIGTIDGVLSTYVAFTNVEDIAQDQMGAKPGDSQ